ncbi:serpin family protein [Tundrisphaera lichenicola]|uniref:serpin family protein n=1 Tax=Tundrisphaera lichenicola TaxID=2029860 RepID=UPI003EB8ED12
MPAIVRANNAFAMALYQRLRTRPGNLLVSPACLSAGLALIRAGARDETARQIARVLHLPDGLGQADHAYAALIRDLNADAEDRSYQIRLANATWVQGGYPLLDSYRATLEEDFATEGHRVDFSGRPEEACRVINAWTESRTGGKIAGMLRPADLPSSTRLALTSSLYLRASWRQRFRRERTRQDRFRVGPDEAVDVPMMNDHSYSSVHGDYDGGSFQALELPCGSGSEFAMVVVLPRESDGLADVEATLTSESLDSWWPRFRQPEEIIIELPKYRIRTDVSLNHLLSEMGMPLAFDSQADFSGINGKSRDLFLSEARHATFLDVHEEGIEAAAAMDAISPDAYGEEPPVFRADHPFLFLIRDTRSRCIVFLGRVVNPLEQ